MGICLVSSRFSEICRVQALLSLQFHLLVTNGMQLLAWQTLNV